MTPEKPDPDELPEHLEHLYDPDETFKIDASPEDVADVLLGGRKHIILKPMNKIKLIGLSIILALIGVACSSDSTSTEVENRTLDAVDAATPTKESEPTGEVGTLDNPVPIGVMSTGPVWEVKVLEAQLLRSDEDEAILILLEVTNISDEIQRVGGSFDFSVRLAVNGQVISSFMTFQLDGNDPLSCGFETSLLPGFSIEYVECVNVTSLGATNANTPAVSISQQPSIWENENSSVWHEMPTF